MVILGSGGFAKEILQVVEQNYREEKIAFYDDVNIDVPKMMFNKYPILTGKEELQQFFQENTPNFVIGIGNPKHRKYIENLATTLGGNLVSAIDKNAHINTYCEIGNGATILNNSNISNSAVIGKAPLIYYNVVITHDCIVGDYVELSPGSTLLGKVHIGNGTIIGANATILPKITIGKNCIIGAGSVVTKNIPDNTVVAGVPAKFLRTTL